MRGQHKTSALLKRKSDGAFISVVQKTNRMYPAPFDNCMNMDQLDTPLGLHLLICGWGGCPILKWMSCLCRALAQCLVALLHPPLGTLRGAQSLTVPFFPPPQPFSNIDKGHIKPLCNHNEIWLKINKPKRGGLQITSSTHHCSGKKSIQ